MIKGFKLTEIGELPIDWNVASLNDVSSMKSGLSITSKKIREVGPFPCYGGNGLRGFTSTYTHEGDYALIGRQGALCGNIQFASNKFFASEHAVVVTPKKNINIKWLSYVLGRMNLNQYSESSAQPGLSVTKLLQLPIPLPPTKAEQTAIATALSDADALITSLERLIAKKKAIKQGAMQRLLKTKGSSSEQGLPATWNITELRHGINLISGQHILSHRVNSEGVGFPYITGPADFPNGIINTKRYAINAHSVCEKNDILITVKGSGTGKIIFADKRYAISRQLMAIRSKNQWDQKCLFHLLEAHASHFSDASAGLIPGISREDILKLRIRLPSNKSEQIAIATNLDNMDAEISLLEKKLEKQKLIKQGMMQVLLTGKVRLV